MGRIPLSAKLILLGVFLSALHTNASAQFISEAHLSLNDSINYAIENNLNLKKTMIDLEASGYSESKLWAEIFPTISASASLGYSNRLFSRSDIPSTGNNFSYSTGISVSLGLNAGIPYAVNNIKLAHEANILRYEDACNQLAIQITKKYYSLIAEKNNLTLLEEVLGLALRQFERSQVLFANGFVGELSLLQSRLSYENARYNLSAANISYMNSMAEFLAMLGLDQNTMVSLQGEVNVVRISADAEALINEYLHKRPDIARNVQEIERLENAQKQLAMSSRAPSLNLSLGWSSRNFSPFTDSFSAEARLSIPIDSWIPGTSRNQNLSRAGDSIEKARLDLEIAQNSAKTQIRSLTALLHNSWDSISIARLSYEASQRSYFLTEQGFNNGIVEALALEDSRNNMTNSRQRLLQSELNYFNMILDLSAAINVDWIYLVQTYGVQSE